MYEHTHVFHSSTLMCSSIIINCLTANPLLSFEGQVMTSLQTYVTNEQAVCSKSGI